MTADLNPSLPAGGGEMGALVRAKDWSKTPLGPIERWSPSLRMMVTFLLANRFPLLLWWGPEYISIYNDAYRPVLGTKHSWALGQPFRECWSEIRDVLEPLIDAPFRGGSATWMEDILLEINRYGFFEETHFTIAYSPVPDDTAPNGIGGVLATVHEITEKVVGERRITALRDLGARGGHAKTAAEACESAVEALQAYSKDVPFAAVYLFDESRTSASLACATGVQPAELPAQICLDGAESSQQTWPLAEVLSRESIVTVENLAQLFSEIPRGPWSEPPRTAVLVPIKSNIAHQLAGVLVAGASPRLKLDEQYRSFFDLAAAQVATAIANARAYEEERKRAEALAEIDRAKTLFFSNVSHEFRTPLTLMLGPLEDALASEDLATAERERLETARRNSLRLLKLVNSLLDFSRIEAGRAQASYQQTDLAATTANIASNFRSACQRAGLGFVVDCPPLGEAVYVDRDMWEKIVLNLLSNAFKFTFDGQIAVRLRLAGGRAELRVSDTGVGIPPHELPRLFERFHRIEGQRSRTYEGSGIGLALVQELVKLHAGTIVADSAPGRGTNFIVTIPAGRSHLPQDRIGGGQQTSSTAIRADAFVEEASHWLPDKPSRVDEELAEIKTSQRESPQIAGARVFIADDNSDMRAYVSNLLGPYCEIQTFADGQAALAAIRERAPDLLLADVMMPRLDGFGLVRAIRSDATLADLPVVLLSARAGEEAKVEGFEAGADDYLVKPFNARELIARVSANLSLAKLRRQTAVELQDMNRLREVANRCARAETPFDECLEAILDAAIAITGADKGNIQLFEIGSDCLKIAAQRGFAAPFLESFAEAKSGDASVCGRALRSFDRVVVEDVTQSEIFAGQPSLDVLRIAGVRAVQSTPLISSAGDPLGMISTHFALPHRPSERVLRLLDLLTRQAADYLERHQARVALEHRTKQFETLLSNAPVGVYVVDSQFRVIEINPTAQSSFGEIPGGIVGRDFDEIIHILWEKNYADEVVGIFRHTLETGRSYSVAKRAEFRADREITEYYEWRLHRITLPDGSFGVVCYFRDISEQVQAENTRQLLVSELNHRVKNTLASVQAIAQQTVRSTNDPADFASRFSGRIQSLARVHSLLTESTWKGADLRELIRDQLLRGPVDETRLTAWGPAVHLEPQMAVHLAVMLHELGTNSVKYGALSAAKGWVTVNWLVAGDLLNLQWIERGGPVVSAPAKRGFGTTLVEQSAKSEGGNAEQLFEPEGITWKISMRLPDSDARPDLSEAELVTPARARDTAKSRDPELAGLRILVVEDESLIALDLLDRLERAGAEVAAPVSTEEGALQVIQAGKFDCALLDANLHGRPVTQIAAALTRCKIPFVFVTGYGRAGLPDPFKQVPALAKPVSDEQLVETVARLASRPGKVLQMKH